MVRGYKSQGGDAVGNYYRDFRKRRETNMLNGYSESDTMSQCKVPSALLLAPQKLGEVTSALILQMR